MMITQERKKHEERTRSASTDVTKLMPDALPLCRERSDQLLLVLREVGTKGGVCSPIHSRGSFTGLCFRSSWCMLWRLAHWRQEGVKFP